MQTSINGLRERKRRETRQRIGAAALDLALAHGLEGATIEAISGAAGVSPRTFFNYFESKDDAVLNMPDSIEAAAVVDAVTAAADKMTVREVAVRLFMELMRVSLESDQRRDERRDLLLRHPHLLAAVFRRMTETQDLFSAALRAIAAERGTPAGPDGAWASVAVAAAVGAVLTVVKEWTDSNGAISVDEVVERANTLLIEAMENLR